MTPAMGSRTCRSQACEMSVAGQLEVEVLGKDRLSDLQTEKSPARAEAQYHGWQRIEEGAVAAAALARASRKNPARSSCRGSRDGAPHACVDMDRPTLPADGSPRVVGSCRKLGRHGLCGDLSRRRRVF